MNKNWLIRTKSNHILGPVSKDKVLELYKNGSIRGEDEICSGNGYWFFIREKELVEKYLTGNKQQTFNPISEAKDILTNDHTSVEAVELHPADDVTMVGKAFNLNDLKEENIPIPPTPMEEIPEVAIPVSSDVSPVKKKISKTKKKHHKPAPKNDHAFLRYLGIFSFILLLAVIYFRKSIMSYLSYVEFFPTAHAQELLEVEKKKSFLDQRILIDGVEFRPLLGLEGLRIVASVSEELDCSKLNDEVTQLGIILFPQDQQNENFLKRLRDCVLPLSDNHPVKKWLKKSSSRKSIQAPQEVLEKLEYIDSLLNSGFNLITAPEQKNKIVTIINSLDEEHLPQRILQSYLYLLIGNVSRSDALLMKTYNISPFVYWTKYPYDKNVWSEAISLRIAKIFERLSKHPADRTNFFLFTKYMYEFFNDENLRASAEQYFDDDVLKTKMGLKVYQVRTGPFASYIQYELGSPRKRRNGVRADVLNKSHKDFPWYWYFFEEFHALPKNEKALVLTPYFEDPSNDSQLFFQFMANSDSVLETFYQGRGQSAIKAKRHFFLQLSKDKEYWWISLFNLIEMGDINQEMVQKIMSYDDGL